MSNSHKIKFGITFSVKECRSLGLDWQEALKFLISEIDISVIRYPVHWDVVEPQKESYDFTELNEFIQLVPSGIEIIPALGRKTPRWPEFHEPHWLQEEQQNLQIHLYRYLLKTLQHLKRVKRVQIENEPLHKFGINIFGKIKEHELAAEIAFVRDNFPSLKIITTDSGEWGNWKRTASAVDILGVNIYAVIYNKLFRFYRKYKLKADYYRKKAENTGKEVIVAELQAEPWAKNAAAKLDLKESRKAMNPDILLEIFNKCKDAGFKEMWFWGAEWWYYMFKVHKESTIIDTVQNIINEYGE